MLPERQQRVLSYFIKEAKDYFKTIEQGLLNLQPILKNTKMVSLNAGFSLPQRRHVNEFFWVDHSLKWGAAMLEINSVQQMAQYLEDYFICLRSIHTFSLSIS